MFLYSCFIVDWAHTLLFRFKGGFLSKLLPLELSLVLRIVFRTWLSIKFWNWSHLRDLINVLM